MKKHIWIVMLLIAMIINGLAGCKQSLTNQEKSVMDTLAQKQRNPLINFFGRDTRVFVSSNKPNGYQLSILDSKDLILYHFERGDSVDVYCALHTLPFDCREYEDSIGTFFVNIDIPVLKENDINNCPDMFFMDVNFDGEEDFVVEHHGYNRMYYACFNIVNGNSKNVCPGLLEPDNEPPYNNIVGHGRNQECYTHFDYKKKEIHIYETMSVNSYMETWCALRKDEYDVEGKVKIIRQESVHGIWSEKENDWMWEVNVSKRVNDTLKHIRTEYRKMK